MAKKTKKRPVPENALVPVTVAQHDRDLLDHLLRQHRDRDMLFSTLVSRICAGMDEGDRFYHAKDDTWWEWRNGHLVSSGPPPKKPDPRIKKYYADQARARG